MKSKALVVVALAFVAGLAQADEDKNKAELKKFEGRWKLASLEVEGDKRDIEEENIVTIKDDRATAKDDQAFSLKLDCTVEPKVLDLTYLGGTEKGNVLEAIYRLKDDELTICLFGGGGAKKRPTEFAGKQGTGCVLIVLKRVK